MKYGNVNKTEAEEINILKRDKNYSRLDKIRNEDIRRKVKYLFSKRKVSTEKRD
jgi:hypothetical protein